MPPLRVCPFLPYNIRASSEMSKCEKMMNGQTEGTGASSEHCPFVEVNLVWI